MEPHFTSCSARRSQATEAGDVLRDATLEADQYSADHRQGGERYHRENDRRNDTQRGSIIFVHRRRVVVTLGVHRHVPTIRCGGGTGLDVVLKCDA